MKTLDHEITARVPGDLYNAALALAAETDQSEGEIVRRALTDYLKRQKAKPAARTSGVQIDERSRQIVHEALSGATCWASFQAALRAEGYEYFSRGGGICIRRVADKKYMAKGSDVGAGYGPLVKRFGAGLPDHPQKWIAQRLLGATMKRTPDQNGAGFAEDRAQPSVADRDDHE